MKGTTWRLSLRNATRRPMRTALTAGMVVFAVALLVIALSWIDGMLGQMLETATSLNGEIRVAMPGYIAREALTPLDENLSDAGKRAASVRAVPGVKAVAERIVAPVTVTANGNLGDVFARAVGASKAYYRDRLHGSAKLSAGRWFTSDRELVAGAEVVKQAHAKLGDTLLLLGRTQDGALSPIQGKLVGIVHTGGAVDHELFLPLSRLQWLSDIPHGATELLVFGRGPDEADALAARLRKLPALKGLAVQPWTERPELVGIARQMSVSRAILIAVVVFLAALGIWNTMTMSVLERTREVGVLRAMGLSRLRAVLLFVGEAVVIGAAGGLLGAALGTGPAWLLARHGIHLGDKVAAQAGGIVTETIHGKLTFEVLLISFGLGLSMAVLGSLPAAIRAAGIRPVSAMRSGR